MCLNVLWLSGFLFAADQVMPSPGVAAGLTRCAAPSSSPLKTDLLAMGVNPKLEIYKVLLRSGDSTTDLPSI